MTKYKDYYNKNRDEILDRRRKRRVELRKMRTTEVITRCIICQGEFGVTVHQDQADTVSGKICSDECKKLHKRELHRARMARYRWRKKERGGNDV